MDSTICDNSLLFLNISSFVWYTSGNFSSLQNRTNSCRTDAEGCLRTRLFLSFLHLVWIYLQNGWYVSEYIQTLRNRFPEGVEWEVCMESISNFFNCNSPRKNLTNISEGDGEGCFCNCIRTTFFLGYHFTYTSHVFFRISIVENLWGCSSSRGKFHLANLHELVVYCQKLIADVSSFTLLLVIPFSCNFLL